MILYGYLPARGSSRDVVAWHGHAGTHYIGTARHGKSWHGKDLARHGTGKPWHANGIGTWHRTTVCSCNRRDVFCCNRRDVSVATEGMSSVATEEMSSVAP